MSLIKIFKKNQNLKEEENQIQPLVQAIEKLTSVLSHQKIVEKEYIESEKEYINIENPINNELLEENNILKLKLASISQERDYLLDKINNNEKFAADEELRDRYIQLLDFAFKNIDPFTTIDILNARYYYENIIKKQN